MTSPVENELSGLTGSIQPAVTFATWGSGFVVTSSSSVISTSPFPAISPSPDQLHQHHRHHRHCHRHIYFVISPPEAEGGLMFCLCFILIFYYFVTIFQTNYLNICQTDPRQICRVCRVKYGCRWRSEVRFSITQGTLPWQPILWSKSRPNAKTCVRLRFARWRRTTRSASAALDACKPKLTDWMDAGEPIN